MPLEISCISEADLAIIARIDSASFRNSPLFLARQLEAGVPLSSWHNVTEGYIRASFARRVEDNYDWVKVTDTELAATGDADRGIISCIVWHFDLSVTQQDGESFSQSGPGAELSRRARQFREDFFKNEPYGMAAVLMTKLGHQGRGAGRMLIQWGCRFCDDKGIISALTTNETGSRVYEQLGYVTVREYELDLHPYGVNAKQLAREMIRQPARKTPHDGKEGMGRNETESKL